MKLTKYEKRSYVFKEKKDFIILSKIKKLENQENPLIYSLGFLDAQKLKIAPVCY